MYGNINVYGVYKCQYKFNTIQTKIYSRLIQRISDAW